MTKTINLLICCLFTISIFAQSFIERNYSDLLNKEEVTRFQVTGKAFEMAAALTRNMNDEDAKNAHKVVSKIKFFDLISYKDATYSQELFKKGFKKLDGYDELIRVKNEKTNVSITVKESNNVISEIVGLIVDEDNFVVFNLIGEINLDEISELAQSMNDETVSRVFKKDVLKNEIKLYPNPVKKGSEASIEVPENMKGGILKIYNSDGKQITSMKLNNNTQGIDTSKFNSATYILKFENNGTEVNKKLIIVE